MRVQDKVTSVQVRAKASRIRDEGPGGGRTGGSLNFAGAGIWLMPREEERKREGGRGRESKRPLAFLARLSFRTLASPPFSRLFIIRANKVNQQAGGPERRGAGEAGERAARERGDRFKQDYQTIKRISTFPGVPGISSSLTLCADEHPRGNFEEDPSERRTGGR